MTSKKRPAKPNMTQPQYQRLHRHLRIVRRMLFATQGDCPAHSRGHEWVITKGDTIHCMKCGKETGV